MTGRLFPAEKFRALVRFGLGGLLSSAVALGTTALLHEVGEVPERVAGGCGFTAALVVNFFVLRHFVFAAAEGAMRSQVLRFLATSGVVRGVEFSAFYLVNRVLHLQYLMAMVLVLCTSFAVKFLVYEGLVFRQPRNSDDDSPPELKRTA